MKKAVILFLCIVITALALSSYVQSLGDSSETVSIELEDSMLDINMSLEVSGFYEPTPNNLEDNPELEQKLLKDYSADYQKLWSESWPNDIQLEETRIIQYFGQVGGCEIAIMPRFGYITAMIHKTTIKIADYTIVINTHFPLLAHCGSEFYELEDAYEKGLLTKEDIYEIGKLVETHGWGKIN